MIGGRTLGRGEVQKAHKRKFQRFQPSFPLLSILYKDLIYYYIIYIVGHVAAAPAPKNCLTLNLAEIIKNYLHVVM